MKAIVVASGELQPGDAGQLDGAALVVAADGGAGLLDGIGRRPDLLVGDLDSVSPALVERLSAAGTRVEAHPADKDASDLELALEAALAAGADEVVVLGAIGGERLDHAIANLLLLADPGLIGRDLRLVAGPATLRVGHGGEAVSVPGAVGDLVTLLPLGGDVEGVTTTGLRWPLERATLRMGRSRGLSNEVQATPASVTLERGTLLVVHTTRGANP